jgi:DNA-binding FrmR family transcriptional regulator
MASHEKNQDGSADVFAIMQTQLGLTPQEIGSDCCRHKHREQPEADALLRRLSRIEGQVRGVRGMVEKEAYCTDILVQVSAIQSALNAFARELLGSHIRTCVVQDIQNGKLDVVDDLLSTIQKMMK